MGALAVFPECGAAGRAECCVSDTILMGVRSPDMRPNWSMVICLDRLSRGVFVVYPIYQTSISFHLTLVLYQTSYLPCVSANMHLALLVYRGKHQVAASIMMFCVQIAGVVWSTA